MSGANPCELIQIRFSHSFLTVKSALHKKVSLPSRGATADSIPYNHLVIISIHAPSHKKRLPELKQKPSSLPFSPLTPFAASNLSIAQRAWKRKHLTSHRPRVEQLHTCILKNQDLFVKQNSRLSDIALNDICLAKEINVQTYYMNTVDRLSTCSSPKRHVPVQICQRKTESATTFNCAVIVEKSQFKSSVLTSIRLPLIRYVLSGWIASSVCA